MPLRTAWTDCHLRRAPTLASAFAFPLHGIGAAAPQLRGWITAGGGLGLRRRQPRGRQHSKRLRAAPGGGGVMDCAWMSTAANKRARGCFDVYTS